GNFTKGPSFSSISEPIEAMLEHLHRIATNCEDLLEADIVSFERYITALRLPKATEEEKETRNRAIEAAAPEAIAIPLRLMEVCLDALRITEKLAPLANKNVISDLGIGVLLFEASAQAALLTVEINLAAIADREARNEYEPRSAQLIEEVTRIKNDV